MTTTCVFSRWPRIRGAVIMGLLAWVGLLSCAAQDLQARRWGHLPVGMNVLGGGYTYTSADIAFDPVLRIEAGEMDMHAVGFQYMRAFEMLGQSARVSVAQGYVDAKWSGLLNGEPASTSRTGFSDTILRFAMLLYGAPPLEGQEFMKYRAGVANCETVVGAGLVVQLPTGHYEEKRLLNFGSNRFTFRPQLGVVHTRGKWSTELTGSVWLYTDNDDFFGGSELENDPLYALQGHVVYTFRPGLWLAAGMAYGYGAQSTIDGVEKDDRKGNLLWGASLGIPINRNAGLKITYIGAEAQEDTGRDSSTIAVGFSVLW